MVGDIYLAEIYFTDLSECKIRPVLILKILGDDVICLPLTTNMKASGVVIKNSDLSNGKLKKESIVVVPKNITLHKSILRKYIATIDKNLFQRIQDIFCKEIGCKE